MCSLFFFSSFSVYSNSYHLFSFSSSWILSVDSCSLASQCITHIYQNSNCLHNSFICAHCKYVKQKTSSIFLLVCSFYFQHNKLSFLLRCPFCFFFFFLYWDVSFSVNCSIFPSNFVNHFEFSCFLPLAENNNNKHTHTIQTNNPIKWM